MNKIEFRDYCRKTRMNIDDRDEKSIEITSKILEMDVYKNSQIIGIYSSLGSEVVTKYLVDAFYRDGKKVAFPKVFEDKSMKFYYVTNLGELETGTYAIREPMEGCVEASKDDIDLIIVPGLAFDKGLNRLGYGIGYYDRYLSDFKGVKIAITYSEMIFDDIQHEEHDIKMDYVVSETKILGENYEL